MARVFVKSTALIQPLIHDVTFSRVTWSGMTGPRGADGAADNVTNGRCAGYETARLILHSGSLHAGNPTPPCLFHTRVSLPRRRPIAIITMQPFIYSRSCPGSFASNVVIAAAVNCLCDY